MDRLSIRRMTKKEVNELLGEAQWDSWQVAKNMHSQCKYLFNNGDLDTIIKAMEYWVKNKEEDSKMLQSRYKKILAVALLMRKVDESYK